MTKMEIIAIIPARGGSKGIPRKNLRFIGGMPLIAHTIGHALRSPALSRVVVSTDDEEIAESSRRSGAEIIMRPAEISGDPAPTELALLHVLDTLRERETYEPDLVVLLQATSPVRDKNDIGDAIGTLVREDADSLFSACRVEGFVWRGAEGALQPLNYEPQSRPRRQELREETLEENGSIYVFKPEILRSHGSRLGGRIAVHVMPRRSSFQLDAPEDVPLIEAVLSANASARRKPELASVELLVLDFDGVMTDNRVLVHQDGSEAVFCSRGDGWGITSLRKAGFRVAVLSTERNPVVAARCAKLGIDCVQGSSDKLADLKAMAASYDAAREHIAYVGNDVNDLDCLHWVGFPIAVADAEPSVLACCVYITEKPGGYGAVREVCEWVMAEEG
jgi:YrbI family 3-deoxy-D-manno-octulosonate 8-phosphate phosphatase